MAKRKKDEMFFGLTLTNEQQEFVDAVLGNDYDVIFVNSKSGTGKTTLAVACAKLLVSSGKYDGLKYIFSPIEESKLGFTPGTVEQKWSKYFTPLIDALVEINEIPEKCIKSMAVQNLKKDCEPWIDAMAHTFLRGCNLRGSVIVIEEAQNFNTSELKKVLTRCHESSKIIVIGHSQQNDLEDKDKSGFTKYIKHFKDQKRCKICTLTKNFRGWVSAWADELVD